MVQKRGMESVKTMGRPRIEKISFAEENFLQMVVSGIEPLEAVKRAYPKVADYPKDRLQKKIYNIYQKPGIKDREAMIKEEYLKVIKERCSWNLEKATVTLVDLIDVNSNEIGRVRNAYDQQVHEIKLKLKKIKEFGTGSPEEIEYYENKLQKLERAHRIDKGSNTAIINAVSELNRMHRLNVGDPKEVDSKDSIIFVDGEMLD